VRAAMGARIELRRPALSHTRQAGRAAAGQDFRGEVHDVRRDWAGEPSALAVGPMPSLLVGGEAVMLVQLREMARWWAESEGVSTVVRGETCLQEARVLARAVLAMADVVEAARNEYADASVDHGTSIGGSLSDLDRLLAELDGGAK
jgi:hypothetical protein